MFLRVPFPFPCSMLIEYYNEVGSHSNDQCPYTLCILISYDIQTDQAPVVYFHLHCVGNASRRSWYVNAGRWKEMGYVTTVRSVLWEDLGSVASLYWVLLLHCIGFGWIIEGWGIRGFGENWPSPSVYVERGGAESVLYPVYPVHHPSRTESDNHWVTPAPTHSLFFPPSFLSLFYILRQ